MNIFLWIYVYGFMGNAIDTVETQNQSYDNLGYRGNQHNENDHHRNIGNGIINNKLLPPVNHTYYNNLQNDKYTLLGYAKGKTNGMIFYLFGIQRKGRPGNFYLSPVNKDIENVKMRIDDNVITDIYSIPNELSISNNLYPDVYAIEKLKSIDYI